MKGKEASAQKSNSNFKEHKDIERVQSSVVESPISSDSEREQNPEKGKQPVKAASKDSNEAEEED